MSAVISLIIFCAVVYFALKFVIKLIKGSPGGNDLRNMVSLAEGKGYVYSNSSGGIALNPDTKQIALAKGRLRKTYSFADIREWEASQITPGMTAFGGMAGTTQNLRAMAVAKAGSGFFVTVRDIDNPKWQIPMPEKEQHRWMEIMRQTVNEN
jgi:hypothetical protein